MNTILSLGILAFVFFIGWQSCLLYLHIGYKKLLKKFPEINKDDHVENNLEAFTAKKLYGTSVHAAINNAREEMRRKSK